MIKLTSWIAVTVALSASALPARAADSPAKPPNILWISSEEGSSIAYTTESGNKRTTHWHLYTAPIEVQKNLRFKGIRLGYEDSAEIPALRN
jgi:hypothetical protein